jgi:hypothetical protein
MIKGASGSCRLVYTVGENDDRFFLPGGLMFFKATQGMTENTLKKLHVISRMMVIRVFIPSSTWVSNLFMAKGHSRYCGLVHGPHMEI